MTDEHRTTTVVLGDEFDDALRTKLLNVLRGLGEIVSGDQSWAIAGSQELEELDVLIDGEVLHVEAETYAGLSISGSADLVNRIQRLMTA